MTAKEQFCDLKGKLLNAMSDEDADAILEVMKDLAKNQPEELEEAYHDWVMEFKDKVDRDWAKQAMDFVTSYLSMSLIAKNYFGKSRAWMSQKLNGHIVNGKPAKFTDEELATLKRALNEIGSRLVQISENL